MVLEETSMALILYHCRNRIDGVFEGTKTFNLACNTSTFGKNFQDVSYHSLKYTASHSIYL